MNDDVREIIEKYLEYTESSADYTQILDDLTSYTERPILLNKASAEELMNFPLLSANDASAIINHRITYGPLLSFAELQVLGFSIEQIRAIMPFASLETSFQTKLEDLGQALKNSKTLVLNTHKFKSPSPAPGGSLGNNHQTNLRIRYSIPGKYSIGLTAEKDPGEMYWNKGPDFYSAHAFFQNVGHIKALALGDYLLSFGQGLVMGSGIGIGKSALVMNVKRNAPNLKPYRGVNEFLYLRGAAIHFNFRKFEIIAAAAINKMDSRLLSDTGALSGLFSSTDLDGYHRTLSETENKSNGQRTMVGTWVQHRDKRGILGIGGNYFQYDKSVNTYEDLYRKYYPTGNQLAFIHFFQAHTLGRNHVFSEWAFCPTNGTKAISAGVLTSLGKNVDFSIHFRNYDPGFNSPFSTAFGNGNQNETGLYTGLKVTLSPKLTLSHFTDFWSNPWLTYRVWSPSKGTDMLYQLEYAPKKKTQMYVRFRNQNKAVNVSGAEPIKRAGENKIYNLRLHLNSAIGDNYQLQLRGETAQNFGDVGHSISSLAFIQINKSLTNTKLIARYTLFNVPSYYNRIYAFENQLQYDFGTVAFYGKGAEIFLMINQKMSRRWKAACRASRMQYFAPGEKIITNKNALYFQFIYSH